jgi:DNA-binding response OmpR family regulator
MKAEKPSILVVEDGAKCAGSRTAACRRRIPRHCAPDAETGIQILNSGPFDVVVTDFKLPGKADWNFSTP